VGQGSLQTEHGEKAQHARQQENVINSYLYIASPAMGNVNLKQQTGGDDDTPGGAEGSRGVL